MATVGAKLTIPFVLPATYSLFPGAATYPGTTTYAGGDVGQIVGQGNAPEAWVLYSTDDASDTDPLWVDATSKLRGENAGFSVSRGREDELSEIDAGTATLVLDNRDRSLDPVSNPLIGPLNRWWIREQFSGETQSVFRGYADSYTQSWPGPVGDAIVTVQCSDELKILGLSGLPITSPARNSYAEVVASEVPAGYWRLNDDPEIRIQTPDVAAPPGVAPNPVTAPAGPTTPFVPTNKFWDLPSW